MSKLIIDSSAWIEYFLGTQKGAKVRELIKNNETYTASISLAEIVSKFKRNKMDAQLATDVIFSNSKIVGINTELSMKAGNLHSEMRVGKSKFSLSDAYVLAIAKALKGKVVTGDYDFKALSDVVFLE